MGKVPEEAVLRQAMEAYDAKNYASMEAICRKMTKAYPKSGQVWMLLGVALGYLGRYAEAVPVHRQAVKLLPNNANVLSNLAECLNSLGRAEEAIAIGRRALSIEPNNVPALINLGNACRDLNKLDEAEQHYCRATKLQPKLALAHNNMGLIHQAKKQFVEAEASYRRALDLQPKDPVALNNLGTVLTSMKRYDDSISAFRQAVIQRPDFIEALRNMSVTLTDVGCLEEALSTIDTVLALKPEFAEAYRIKGDILRWQDRETEACQCYQKSIDIQPEGAGLRAAVWLAVHYYIYNDKTSLLDKLTKAEPICCHLADEEETPRIYWRYLRTLLNWHQMTEFKHLLPSDVRGKIHVVGDSHVLSAHGMSVCYRDASYECAAEWIEGCKLWHLGNTQPNKYKIKFELVLERLPRGSDLLLTIGEIDCRPDEGILAVWKKGTETELSILAKRTVTAYVDYVLKVSNQYGHRLILSGVPAPHASVLSKNQKSRHLLLEVVRLVNGFLKEYSVRNQLGFLNVYGLTAQEDGSASGSGHIDQNHLVPYSYCLAFTSFCHVGMPQIEQLIELFQRQEYGAVRRNASIGIEMDPQNGNYWKLLGAASNRLGKPNEALEAFKRSAELLPDDAEAMSNYAVACFDQGMYEAAEAAYLQALKLGPDLPEAQNNVGVLYKHQHRYIDAQKHLSQAIKLKPEYVIAHFNLAGCLKELGRYHEALEHYRKAVELAPEDARYRLALLCSQIPIALSTDRETKAAISNFDHELVAIFQWVSASPKQAQSLCKAAGTQQPYFLAYIHGNHTARLSRYGNLFAVTSETASTGPSKKRSKIRLGIITQHFCRHSVWDILIKGYLTHIDRSRFEVILYFTGDRQDKETSIAKSKANLWRDKSLIHNDTEWVRTIRKDALDVIYYPEIGMDPVSVKLATMRLAPLQIASWGHPITTGLSTIDIYLSGELIEPPQANDHYRERLMRLPGTGCCTVRIDIKTTIPKEANSIMEERPGPRFLLAHRVFKFRPECDELLIKIALEVGPCSFIFLEDPNYPWATLQFLKRLKNRFLDSGLPPEQYLLCIPWLSREEFAGLLSISDIYLDCPSFSGYTTAWQAIQHGLPIVTLEGPYMRQRLASGLLRQIGAPETISHDFDQYVKIAIHLAFEMTDRVKWQARKARLKALSSLADNKLSVVREFERIIQKELDIRFGSSSLSIEKIAQLGQSARFSEMITECKQLLNQDNSIENYLNVGVLLSTFGFVNEARKTFLSAHSRSLNDFRPAINLANLARDVGDHAESRHRYSELLQQLPDHPVVRRNALTSLEYDPEATDAERLNEARVWGKWAIDRSGGEKSRPHMEPLNHRPLRLCYVSADLCQHSVGLLVKDILKTHDTKRVKVFAYNTGQVKDWVTEEIRTSCTLRDISGQDDGAAMIKQIRQDCIDVLIDLSGHTAGSCLTTFAHRPAPVMVSWLGYFATTGLPYIDAVILDDWHAHKDAETLFVEPIIRLPGGRICYQPVPWAPAETSPAPFRDKGYITFGCFNNTAKFNEGLFDVWAKVLTSVSDSHLILKWRTFNDEAFRQQITSAFVQRGITADRIELRGPSFHIDLLKEYADIDIALDPFPFTGGLTSCEALWMGVPVVTWPQGRVVSRQTFAFLSSIGITELAANTAEDYVRIAAELAKNHDRLKILRTGLRKMMRSSSLMDVTNFTRHLENTLIDLYCRIKSKEKTRTMKAKIILHVGPGHRVDWHFILT